MFHQKKNKMSRGSVTIIATNYQPSNQTCPCMQAYLFRLQNSVTNSDAHLQHKSVCADWGLWAAKMQLDILPGRKMRWLERKENFGSQKERHKLGKFVLQNCKSNLPVRVWVSKLNKSRKFSFAPVLVNRHARNVVFYYKKFLVCMNLEDTTSWIRTFIIRNRLYEQERFHCNL